MNRIYLEGAKDARKAMLPTIDRLLLIGSGVIVTVLAVGGLLVLDHRYHMSRDWQLFALFAFGYLLMTAYGVRKNVGTGRARIRLLKLAVPLVISFGIVVIVGVLFYFKVVPFPRQNIWHWGIGMTLLAMATTIASVELANRIERY